MSADKPFTLNLSVRSVNGKELKRTEKSFRTSYDMWVWYMKNKSTLVGKKKRKKTDKKVSTVDILTEFE